MAAAFLFVLGTGVLSLALYALGMTFFLGVVLPYAAVLVFAVGCIRRIVCWAASPVPFPIALTGGQQKSLPWIRQAEFEAPSSGLHIAGRLFLDIVLFRPLLRNSRAETLDTPEGMRLVYWPSRWLWLFAILFHYALLVILIRHLRFFIEPVPACIRALEFFDTLMRIGSPAAFLSGPIVVAALFLLLLRRLYDPKLRYISLAGDYFPLFLLLAVALSGIFLRYWGRTDIASVKALTMGLVTFSPAVPAGIGAAFYLHTTFVAALLICFPFSKLMHAAGVLLSPTRNTAANSREFRHTNPWNGPTRYRTYAEYEDEFRGAMAEAGLPLEKEPGPAGAE
ncbi:MAG: sulfate reduction electron transfer complex DsrMKJOP subunit DsrM [Deltaproteobacteria bacterium]|nr:sulfate reduction electron transfer complex DsrMKJOP subunit DsrM [Deltaproteobacteria bacterium]